MVLESGSGDRLTPDGEAEALRASRERLVIAADADRHRLERELHEGVQQHLVALAVKLQLAEAAAGSDPEAVRSLLEEMRDDVAEALDEAARLAQRIHAPLELGGIAAALRAAVVSAGTPATVEVDGDGTYPDEIARTVFLCWLEALEVADGETGAAIKVREERERLLFEVSTATTGPGAVFESLRDRVQALGGRLTIERDLGGLRVSGSLPL